MGVRQAQEIFFNLAHYPSVLAHNAPGAASSGPERVPRIRPLSGGATAPKSCQQRTGRIEGHRRAFCAHHRFRSEANGGSDREIAVSLVEVLIQPILSTARGVCPTGARY